MILAFKQFVNGKPTHFVQKILSCKHKVVWKEFTPKIHTIRKGNRWKQGDLIHMATGVRTKNYHQFNKGKSGLDVCKRVQSIEIFRVDNLPPRLHDGKVYSLYVNVPKLNETFCTAFRVQIDGRFLSVDEIKKLAVHDGFDTADEMFHWFNLEEFQGQLIHWTHFVY